ncbi:hypothetical protein NP233_g12943 [Leucocoprinus birnbaumii]|uniref:Uncharacterized protein n=1 Tax=Leucocoprinus birnbaumii TaxID=56174 RepID=A0AAD5YJ26_9AGAR|nr:hypothetical protein NP233_g12943 [Leucocoprinus birnbaumii]
MDQGQYYEENRFRGASHAGSWYTSNAPQLTADLLGWLGQVRPQHAGQQFPPPGCKAIIAPHAGYAYSGETAAWAYKCIDPSTTILVLMMRFRTFFPVVNELSTKGPFEWLPLQEDEREHSIEMQLPYLRKVCEGKDIKIVPILVGALDQAAELRYGEVLAPYLAQEGTVFVVSSDFCHWGNDFDYMFYYPKENCKPIDGYDTTRASPPEKDYKIWQSITQLDHAAMGILGDNNRNALQAHTDFHRYLRATGNTICGRHPIGVLYGALAVLENQGRKASCTWVKYDQSCRVTQINENSVSYASAWIKI